MCCVNEKPERTDFHCSVVAGKLQLKRAPTAKKTYRNLSKIRPWVMNLSGCSKKGMGIFSKTLSLKNRPTPFESRLSQVLRHNRFVMYIITSKIAAKQYSKNSNIYK